LTWPPDPVSSSYRRPRHQIPTQIATAPSFRLNKQGNRYGASFQRRRGSIRTLTWNRRLGPPSEGGATSWADLCAVYAGLPDRLKRAVEGRRAILSYVKACRLPGRRDDDCRREGARANGHEATLLLRRPMRRRPGPRRQLIGHRLCHARDVVFVFTPRWLQIRIPRRTIEPCSKRWSRSFGLHARRASGVARAAE